MLTELVELPGGSFRMGSTQFYPEEAPVHTRDRRGLRRRTPSGDQRAVRRIRRRHRLCHRRRAAARSRAVSGSCAAGSGARRAGVPADPRPGGSARLAAVVGLGAGRELAPPVRPGQRYRGSRSTTRWCRSPIPTRRPTPTGRAVDCRPRPSGSTRLAAAPRRRTRGATSRAGRAADGQHLAGTVPVPQ